MVFMNSWIIEQYGAIVGDDFIVIMNYFQYLKWLLGTFGTLHTTVLELEMILLQKITNLNVSNVFSRCIDY